MIVIDYSFAFKVLDKFVTQYNESQDCLRQHIRQSIVGTAKEIIRIYGLFLTKSDCLRALDRENLPPLRTNNEQLATLTHSSNRTIQRHIKRLLEAGILTHKKWRGTNTCYELWINTEMLCVRPPMKVENHKKSSLSPQTKSFENNQKTKVKEIETTSWPQSDFSGYNTNNIIKDVHRLKPDDTNPNIAGDKNAGHTREKYTGAAGFDEKKETRGAGPDDAREKKRMREGQPDGEVKTPEDPKRTASLDFYANCLWLLAKNTIYKNTYLTPNQQAIGPKLLRKWYEPVADHDLEKVHQIYVERIGMANKYILKDPVNHYAQLPYRYFDLDNPKPGCFAGTKIWWKNFKHRQFETQKKLILNAQVKKFLNNEKTHKRSTLEVFRECEQRIGKLGDSELLKQFHAAVLPQNIFQITYT
jgi:hypothetical protein